MIYSFFETGDASRPGLGNFIIMDHIIRAGRAGLPYVYLGYWIDGCDRMAYKRRFKPVEALIGGAWRELGE
jgi:arginine-tRNA-protein transferase